MFFSDINAEMQNMQFSDKQKPIMNPSPNESLLLHENCLLRERNSQLTQLNNSLMIEISQLKLELDMMELKKAMSCQEDR